MVERHVTNGRRIGQLLASELTGLEVGVLATVEVVDADPDASPSETGVEAYRVTHCGRVLASVWLYPDHIEVCLLDDHTWPDDYTGPDDHTDPDDRTGPDDHGGSDSRATRDVPTVESDDRLRVASGAAVKPAVDRLRDVLASTDGQ